MSVDRRIAVHRLLKGNKGIFGVLFYDPPW